MKKEVPNIINIQVPFDPHAVEGLLLQRFNDIIKEEYVFPIHDFDLFCAILVKRLGVQNVPEYIRSWAYPNEILRAEVKYKIILLQEEQKLTISEEDLIFYKNFKRENAIKRMNIVKREISRTGVNPKLITISNSEYYRNLLWIISDFDDLTFIDWFVPIVLTFERFVHIYVKHVEETKINEGNFKRRSFFDYRWDVILKLLKKILKQEENHIKNHFLDITNVRIENDITFFKPYLRGIKNFDPIVLGDDKFRLHIDENGFIQTFFQIK